MRLLSFTAAVIAAAVGLAAVHLTQGTAAVGVSDIVALVTGNGSDSAVSVVIASRLPRLAAGILVGVALGVAGLVMQSVSRNVLASPDTLAVNAGATVAITATAALGMSLPVLSGGAVAFVGGLAAAGLVLGLAGRGGGPVRLVLAGSAVALGLSAIASALLLLFAQETSGLFAWGSGNLAQTGMSSVATLLPVVAIAIGGLLVLGRRFDILALGDDNARMVGLNPARIRVIGLVLAVVLAAAAATVAGPIGFVGLAAPAIVRLLAPRIPGLHRHRALVPLSALVGVVLMLGADVVLRSIVGAESSVAVPTGVVTTIIGAVFLIALAFRVSASTVSSASRGIATLRSPRFVRWMLVALSLVLAAVILAAVLLGDAKLLLGDLALWISGQAPDALSFILNSRLPRVGAALLAGAALALAGAVIQAISRNALAEPGVIGVVGGSGLAAIAIITIAPLAGTWQIATAAFVGGTLAAALVFGLGARGGLATNRLVLVGIAVSAATSAMTTLLIVSTDPFNGIKALTWLAGSTYGRSAESLLPIAVAVAVAIPVLIVSSRQLDLVALNAETPRLLGVQSVRVQWSLGLIAVVLTAAAVASVGVISFVGLVAPHAARALVGSKHSRALPTAAILGAILVTVADTIGRTAIAPAQLPAGIMTALIGAPYFVWLLWRSRPAAAR